MLISKTTDIAWNAKNKKRFVELGYKFTKMRDTFTVRVDDLSRWSSAIVKVKCDYCGKEYEMMWRSRASQRKGIEESDCCLDCCEKKAADIVAEKYGDYSGRYYASNEKRKRTNILRYGCENVFGCEEIQLKIIETNLDKYGVKYSQQSDVVREKTKRTNMDRYGVENYVELFKGKMIKENSPNWKGGPEYSRVERATYEYSVWRKAVFSRDKYTCQKCGAKSHKGNPVTLNAHHIKNWRDNPELRYDEENGITLCEKCHREFHSLFGKSDTTQEQLHEFLFDQEEKIC